MIRSFGLNERRDEWRRVLCRVLDSKIEIRFFDEIGWKSASVAGLCACDFEPGRISILVARPDIAGEPWAILDAILLHESAHAAGMNSSGVVCNPEGLQAMAENQHWQTWPAHVAAPWAGHDLQFIRTLIHLGHRLKSRGVFIPTGWAFQNTVYQLSSLEDYAAALGDEPQRLDWIGLKDVLCRAVPAELSELWQRDTGAALIGSFERC